MYHSFSLPSLPLSLPPCFQRFIKSGSLSHTAHTEYITVSRSISAGGGGCSLALLWKSEGFVFLIDGEVLLLGGFKHVKVNFYSFIIGEFHKGPCFVALYWDYLTSCLLGTYTEFGLN